MKITALPHAYVKDYIRKRSPATKAIVIWITCVDDPEEIEPIYKNGIIAWKDFLFDDIDKAVYGMFPINDLDANAIVDMVEKFRSSISEIIVSCEAGYSRSPAVGAALSKYLNGTDDEFFSGKYYPNMLVYRTVLWAATKRREETDG